jgi:hypothetical protein
MPYVEKLLDDLDDYISDLGWEKNSIEYAIDMIPDEEECPLINQEASEVKFAYKFPEENWNSDLIKYKKRKGK